LLVRHFVCGNRICCNPQHLATGTDADNAADREKDGNTARGDRSGSRTHPEKLKRGRNHYLAVLDNAIAKEIRSLYPGLSQKALAKRFGVSNGTIYNVLHGKHWAFNQ